MERRSSPATPSDACGSGPALSGPLVGWLESSPSRLPRSRSFIPARAAHPRGARVEASKSASEHHPHHP